MAETSETITEADILAAIVADDEGDLPEEAARSLLALHFRPSAIDRMNDLAERNRVGELSEVEQSEFQKYLRVGAFLNLVQAKARRSLKGKSASAD